MEECARQVFRGEHLRGVGTVASFRDSDLRVKLRTGVIPKDPRVNGDKKCHHKERLSEFPDGPGNWTGPIDLACQCRGCRFDFWSGSLRSHMPLGQKNKT